MSKKICFINYGNMYLAPYINNYLTCLKEDTSYDVIYWNRHSINEKINDNYFPFNFEVKDNCKNKFKKAIGYLKFSSFCKKLLKKNNYDVVIVLQSVGTVFLHNILVKKYKNKYVVDIRDYSIEGNKILYSFEEKCICNSGLNVISSPGYLNFLPKNNEYLLVHNFNKNLIQNKNNSYFKPKDRIKLAYIGLIRFQDQNKKIIDLFLNDNRFEIYFIGKNANELSSYININKANNVILIDQFPPDKTLNYFNSIDGILNVYGNNTPLLDYALSNKLYFSALLKKPILVSKDTYMEKYSLENGFGFVLDFEDKNIKESLLNFFENINPETFSKRCDAFLTKVSEDNLKFEKRIFDLLN